MESLARRAVTNKLAVLTGDNPGVDAFVNRDTDGKMEFVFQSQSVKLAMKKNVAITKSGTPVEACVVIAVILTALHLQFVEVVVTAKRVLKVSTDVAKSSQSVRNVSTTKSGADAEMSVKTFVFCQVTVMRILANHSAYAPMVLRETHYQELVCQRANVNARKLWNIS